MKYIMFTKHLQGLDLPGLAETLKSVGVQGADLCVRPGYPVAPDNVSKSLPEAVKRFADQGMNIPLVTTPTDFVRPDVGYAERLYEACAEAGVGHVKVGYWRWTPGRDYWESVSRIRSHLEGFAGLSARYGVQTCLHTHSGTFMGLNSCAMMDLVGGFDPKRIGVFADPGHLAICGEPVEMALNILGEYLSILAFKDLELQRTQKDGTLTWTTRVVPLGQGFVDWRSLLGYLKRIQHPGWISLHAEYPEPVDRVVALARADLRFVNSLLGQV